MELIILRGLPASGKTTWARRYVLAHPDAVRVNRDELRAMLHAERPHSQADEAVSVRGRDALICSALLMGRTVIVDDTNLRDYHIDALSALARTLGAVVTIRRFDVPLEECIKRDAQRVRPVGADVIRRMAETMEG